MIHRHDPDLGETLDLMFGVHIQRPQEAVVDVEQVREDIDLLSGLAFLPAPESGDEG